jgi:hypothetical protein
MTEHILYIDTSGYKLREYELVISTQNPLVVLSKYSYNICYKKPTNEIHFSSDSDMLLFKLKYPLLTYAKPI